MSKLSKTLRRAVPAIALATALQTTAGLADEVTLEFIANELTITGELVTMDDEGYLMITEMGEIHVPAEMVTCTGEACAPFVVASDS